MKKTGMLALASAALLALAACKNGGNNVRDTSGMSAGAQPSVAPATGAAATPTDTTKSDTTKKGPKNP